MNSSALKQTRIDPEIHIFRNRLSDGSETFDITFFQFNDPLYCVSESDAYELAEKIRAGNLGAHDCGQRRHTRPGWHDRETAARCRVNSLSPTQAAYAQMDAWSADYDKRLRDQRASHARLTRANPVAFRLAILEAVGENPMAWALAVDSILSDSQRDSDVALRMLVTSALVADAESAVDVPQSDLFGAA